MDLPSPPSQISARQHRPGAVFSRAKPTSPLVFVIPAAAGFGWWLCLPILGRPALMAGGFFGTAGIFVFVAALLGAILGASCAFASGGRGNEELSPVSMRIAASLAVGAWFAGLFNHGIYPTFLSGVIIGVAGVIGLSMLLWPVLNQAPTIATLCGISFPLAMGLVAPLFPLCAGGG